ncbi:MAG: hypothetical protein GX316_06600 [Firmicutes bacterium]|nr:hypothetical protein [Bacillota bacterium]
MLQFLTEWVKNLVLYLLVSSFLLMMLPDSSLKGFVRFVVGLLLIALLIGPFIGDGFLARLEQLTFSMDDDFKNLEVEFAAGPGWELEQKAENMLEKGSHVMWEQTEKHTDRQLGVLLGLLTGVGEAEVVSQFGSRGEPKNIIVQLRPAQPVLSAACGDGNGQNLHIGIEQIKPVRIGSNQSMLTHENAAQSVCDLAGRVRSWVAEFYGLDQEQVMVNIVE